MKPLLLFTALAMLPLGAAPGARLAPITIYSNFQQQTSAAVLNALQHEVQAIMSPMGLYFKWLDLSTNRGNQPALELAVITFKGRCDLTGTVPPDANPGALGWTHVSDGVILPFADVDCTAVRAFLQRDLLSSRAEESAAIFGRALGRVLAHELYHIFANTRHHGAEGVGREFYTVHDLLTADFHFEARESQALIHSAAHAALESGTAAAPLDNGDVARHF
jgi:hypothetical protein